MAFTRRSPQRGLREAAIDLWPVQITAPLPARRLVPGVATLDGLAFGMGAGGEMSEVYIERDAVISDCGKYRYLLRRVWDHRCLRGLFVMLNPSTADAKIDDATIRSCTRLSRGLGYGSFEVVNLFAWRATNPAELASSSDPIGTLNDSVIESAVSRCDVVICAWGAHDTRGRDRRVWEIVRSSRPAAFCLGTTKNGSPKHPLYIKSGTPLEAYSP